jgi:hypothetical protein
MSSKPARNWPSAGSSSRCASPRPHNRGRRIRARRPGAAPPIPAATRPAVATRAASCAGCRYCGSRRRRLRGSLAPLPVEPPGPPRSSVVEVRELFKDGLHLPLVTRLGPRRASRPARGWPAPSRRAPLSSASRSGSPGVPGGPVRMPRGRGVCRVPARTRGRWADAGQPRDHDARRRSHAPRSGCKFDKSPCNERTGLRAPQALANRRVLRSRSDTIIGAICR